MGHWKVVNCILLSHRVLDSISLRIQRPTWDLHLEYGGNCNTNDVRDARSRLHPRTIGDISQQCEESTSSRPYSQAERSTHRNACLQRVPATRAAPYIEWRTIRTFWYVQTDTVSAGERISRYDYPPSEIYQCCERTGNTRKYRVCIIFAARLIAYFGHRFRNSRTGNNGKRTSLGWSYKRREGCGNIISFKRRGDDASSFWSRFALSVLFVRRAGIKRDPWIKRKFSRYIEPPRIRGTPLFPCRNTATHKTDHIIVTNSFWKFINEDICGTIIHYICSFICYVNVESSYSIVFFKLINYR